MIKFGMLADLHYGYENVGSRFCPLGRAKLKYILPFFKDCDFILNLGDLINGTEDFEATSRLLAQLQEEMAGYPVVHVIGNHDAFHLNKSQFVEVADPKLGAVNFFDRDGVRFIILDCNFYADGTPYDCTHGDWTDTICPSIQLRWLKARLDECESAVVILHHTLINGRGDPAESLSDPHMVRNSDEIREIIEASGKVKYVISGHNHDGVQALHHGILYYTVPALCQFNNAPFVTAAMYDGEITFTPRFLQLPKRVFLDRI